MLSLLKSRLVLFLLLWSNHLVKPNYMLILPKILKKRPSRQEMIRENDKNQLPMFIYSLCFMKQRPTECVFFLGVNEIADRHSISNSSQKMVCNSQFIEVSNLSMKKMGVNSGVNALSKLAGYVPYSTIQRPSFVLIVSSCLFHDRHPSYLFFSINKTIFKTGPFFLISQSEALFLLSYLWLRLALYKWATGLYWFSCFTLLSIFSLKQKNKDMFELLLYKKVNDL